MNKKIIALSIFSAIGAVSFAQNDLTDDDWVNIGPHIVTEAEFVDRVGIGTQNPDGKLHIEGIDPSEEGLLIYRDQTPFSMSGWKPLVDISLDYQDFQLNTVNNPAFIVDDWGKIGLGTRNPTAELHLLKSTYLGGITLTPNYMLEVESENHGYTAFGVTSHGLTHVGEPYSDASVTHATRAEFEVWGNNNCALDMNVNWLSSFRNWAGNGRVLRLKGGWAHNSNTTPIFQVESNGDYDENVRFRILANGKVGIGDITLDMPGDYRLYVDDGILTEQVKVALRSTTEWADYVFEEGYVLKPLEEVEAFIEENGHLPDVPSAEKMVETGLDVAATDAMLLQKIEELTLYTIELQKQILALQAQEIKKQ